MFLSELNSGEKKNFLEVAKFSMGLDGIHKEEEKMIFNSFVHECDLADYSLQKQDNIDSAIKVLAKSQTKNKKILLIELFGILLSDGDVCEEEAAFMDKLATTFGFEEYQVRKIQRWVEAMNDIVEEGYNLINKE